MKFLMALVVSFSIPAFSSETTYFSGEDVMKSPDGKIVYNSYPKLVKRVVDKGSNEISEEVILKIYQGDFEKKDVKLIVKGSKFEILFDGLKGTGEFYGIPWAWSGWTTAFDLPDGTKLKTLDFLNADGLTAAAEYYDPKGQLVSVTFSELKKIEAISYEDLKKKLLAK